MRTRPYWYGATTCTQSKYVCRVLRAAGAKSLLHTRQVFLLHHGLQVEKYVTSSSSKQVSKTSTRLVSRVSSSLVSRLASSTRLITMANETAGPSRMYDFSEAEYSALFDEIEDECKSTKRGYAGVVKLINYFIDLHNELYPGEPLIHVDELKKEDLDTEAKFEKNVIVMFRKFASFLMKHKNKDGKHFKSGTQTQYFSNLKNYLQKRKELKDIAELKHANSKHEWYHDLLKMLRLSGQAAAILRGETISDKRKGIRRKLLREICMYLLKQPNQIPKVERVVILALYYAVGRGGEVSAMNFNTMEWDAEDERLWTGWFEFKTGQSNAIDFLPDGEGDFLLDFYHAFAEYIICCKERLANSPNITEPNWLFPDYASLADGGAAAKTGRTLEKMVDHVPGLTKKHGSHAFRDGATDDMLAHPMISLIEAIMRGNW
jgi:hypothetical protein